jgi:hypothetical protein
VTSAAGTHTSGVGGLSLFDGPGQNLFSFLTEPSSGGGLFTMQDFVPLPNASGGSTSGAGGGGQAPLDVLQGGIVGGPSTTGVEGQLHTLFANLLRGGGQG